MKKRSIIIVSVIVVFLLIGVFIIFRPKAVILEEEEKKELLSVLDIQDAQSFKFLSIDREDLGFGDNTDCYTLKFELSIEDYHKNNLNYKDGESAELACNFKIKKDNSTYICSVREWEYHTEERKTIYEEIKKLYSKYYGIKALKALANVLDNN